MVQHAPPVFPLPVDELTLPGKGTFERIDGELVSVAPVDEPHSLAHTSLIALLTAHVAPGYQVGLDMLTRVSADSEVAPDACIYPVARDATGHRQLEELAFEVLSTERRRHAARKAQLLAARGVRRIIAIDLRWSQVLEWDRALGDWRLLVPGSTIDDPCLVRPLSTNALRGIQTSDEVMAGMVSQRHQVILHEADRSRMASLHEAVLDMAELLDLDVTDAQRAALASLDLAGLEALRAHIKRHRGWPA